MTSNRSNDATLAQAESASADRRRWLALYVLCAGVLMDVLDATIVNVALPSIKGDLGFSQSGLAWVLNAYLISFGGLLLLAGRVATSSASGAFSWPGSPSSRAPRRCALLLRARGC
jgi:MFS family permease